MVVSLAQQPTMTYKEIKVHNTYLKISRKKRNIRDIFFLLSGKVK